MSKDCKEDVPNRDIERMMISLSSSKIKVLVIGGGRAGFIKAKAFASRGCKVTVLSPEFDDAFDSNAGGNLCLVKSCYTEDYLKEQHLIIIAVSDGELSHQITQDCEALAKLYLRCDHARDGIFIVPAISETKQSVFAYHTKEGSPATAVYIRDKIQKQLQGYDVFIEYVCRLRNTLRGNEKLHEIMQFVNTDDFLMFFQKNKHQLILKLFYGGIDVEY